MTQGRHGLLLGSEAELLACCLLELRTDPESSLLTTTVSMIGGRWKQAKDLLNKSTANEDLTGLGSGLLLWRAFIAIEHERDLRSATDLYDRAAETGAPAIRRSALLSTAIQASRHEDPKRASHALRRLDREDPEGTMGVFSAQFATRRNRIGKGAMNAQTRRLHQISSDANLSEWLVRSFAQ